MSIGLANDEKEQLGQIASNQGYTDLVDAVADLEKTPGNMPLIVFIDRGYTDAVDGCVKALKALADDEETDDDVKTTAKGLAELMNDQTFCIITDGTSSPYEEKD